MRIYFQIASEKMLHLEENINKYRGIMPQVVFDELQVASIDSTNTQYTRTRAHEGTNARTKRKKSRSETDQATFF